MSAQSIQSIKDQMTAMEQSLSQMRLAIEALTAEPSAKVLKAPKPEGAEPKAPSAWNLLVNSTLADMRQNGWESWTDFKGVVWPASRRGPLKDKSGAQSEGFVYDGGDHDGKPPSPALGGMVRASYLKAQSDPSAAAKAAAYYAALDDKPSAAAEPKKAGRPPTLAQRLGLRAPPLAPPTAKAESGESASEAEKPKKAGRPPMTAEQKAAAAAKRAATKAAKASAASDAESVKTCCGMPEGWAELLGETIAPKKVNLSFYPFTYEGQKLIMNDRGDVIEPEQGLWFGRLNKGILDKTVPEPEDLEGGIHMRE